MTKVTSGTEFDPITVVHNSNAVNETTNFLTKLNNINSDCKDIPSNKTLAMGNHVINAPDELQASLAPNEIVIPGQYKIFSNRSEPVRYLCAYGAKDSVIISVCSPKMKNCGLYHINNTPLFEDKLKAFLKKIGCIKNASTWKVTMVGGNYLEWCAFGFATRIKTTLQNQYNITPGWHKGSWFWFNAKTYGVLFNVKTHEQKDFEHTDRFGNNLNNDLKEQRREQAGKHKKNSVLSTRRESTLPTFDYHAILNEKNKKITESNYFASIHYSITAAGIGARTNIDKFSQALDQCQGEMLLASRKEQIAKIEEIHQQLNLQDTVELKILKNTPTHSNENNSFYSHSTKISQSILSSRSRDTRFSSSNITQSTAISVLKGNIKPFTILNSSIYTEQQNKFTDQQYILAKKAIDELENRRQHKSSHPMQGSNFPPFVLAALKKEFPDISLDKLYSRDLGDWEATGNGRGAWRIVSVRYSDNQLVIAGVFDNHKVTYRQW